MVAAALLVLVEAASLVSRGARGQSDVSVYYRTCHLLRDGVGPALYPRLDAETGWPIGMPPIGFAIYQPFSVFDPAGASVAWAAFNVAMLVTIVVTLRSLLSGAGEGDWPALRRRWPWVVAVLAALASASLQVGQFSILFVTCWVLFMHAFDRQRFALSALWLAIPAAIKVYPGMLVAVPVSLILMAGETWPRQRVAAGARYLVAFATALLAVWLVAPMLAYGTQAWALNLSWLQHVILNNAHVDYLHSLRTITNQSLDTVLLRYLSYDPAFHDQYRALPHLAFDKRLVLQLANVGRVLILLVTAAAVRARTPDANPARRVITMTAVWSSALYLVLPETKARYAVYLFIAMLPWLACDRDRVSNAPAQGGPRAAGMHTGITLVLLVVLSVGLLPDVLLVWGAGFLAPLAIWIGNLKILERGTLNEKRPVPREG